MARPASIFMNSSTLGSLSDLFLQINLLKSLPRTGWLLAGVAPVESVADHTCAVALYALFLAGQINRDPAANGLEAPLQLERVLAIALLHDLPEVAVTDLPRRATQLLGAEAKRQAEQSALAQLLAQLPDAVHWQSCWAEYADAATPEARLVKDVDKLEMAFQAQRYAARGHTNLAEFQQGHRWHFALCQRLFQSLIG